MENHMLNNIAERLSSYFKDKEKILLVFIFGSVVNGRSTNESDIDIAVLFGDAPDFSEVLEITAEVSAEIKRDVDIVVLNNSSPVIRMQVLKNGNLIKGNGSAVYNNFMVRTVKEYDDLKYIRKGAEENILRGRIYA